MKISVIEIRLGTRELRKFLLKHISYFTRPRGIIALAKKETGHWPVLRNQAFSLLLLDLVEYFMLDSFKELPQLPRKTAIICFVYFS